MGNKTLHIISILRSLQLSPLSGIKGTTFNPFSLAPAPLYFSNSISNSEPRTETKSKPHENSLSNSHSSVAQFVISEFPQLWKKEAEIFCKRTDLQSIIRLGFHLSPEILRPFLRVSELKPENFLEIILGFEHDVNIREITYLWKLFKWCGLQNGEFHHLTRSYQLMASLLTKSHMLDEAKSLLLSLDKPNILLRDRSLLFSNLIQSYSQASKLDNSMILYDHSRDKNLILSGSCYNSLLRLLIKNQKSNLVVRVYNDMLNAGLGFHSEKHILDFVITTLTNRGNILATMKIIRVLKNLDIIPSQEAISSIAEGFCRKKDFRDMMNFLEYWGIIPKTLICNKLVYSLCKNLGSEEGWVHVQKLEKLGFKPDVITFGILVCESCRDGNVKDALLYLSECFNRNIMPKVYAYNAIMSGIFKKGMYRHASYVFDDLLERGLKPNLDTFRVLLAGYCKYRKLDEVEKVIFDIKTFDLISLDNGACFFSKAMSILGLDNLRVKLRRDNGIGFPKAEFFDNLGNGLYLETDLDKFESSLDEILDLEMVPNLDLEMMNELKKGDLLRALEVRDEAMQFGQEISLDTNSELLRCLCGKPTHVNYVASLLEEMPQFFEHFDSKILNLIVQFLSQNKMAIKARFGLEKLISREMFVERESYTSLLIGFRDDNNILGFKESLELAKKGNWLPEKDELEFIYGFLCNFGAVKETLDFLYYIEKQEMELFNDVYKVLVEMLCKMGYTNFACAIIEGIINKGLLLDNPCLLFLIKGFLNEKKDSEALGLFEIWYERNEALDTGTALLILSLLIKFDCVDKAISLVPVHNISLYQTLLKELCLNGKLNEAKSIFQGLILKNYHLDESCLNAVLQGYCNENNYKKALEIFSFMFKKGFNLSVNGFQNLVTQICANKQFDSVLNLAKIIEGQNGPSEIIFKNILIFHLFQARNEVLVERVLAEMDTKCIKPNNITYDFLIYGLYKCGNIPKLIEAFSSSIFNGFKPNKRSLRIVMAHFCNRGDLVEALELYNLIKVNKWEFDSSIINTLGLTLILSGQHLEAKSICEEAPENFYLDPLIKHFCIIGDVKTAINLINKMIKRGIVPTNTSYSELVRTLSLNKELDRALDFFTEMKFEQLVPNSESCETLIYNLCDLGRLDDAILILKEMVQIGSIPSYQMYNYVLEKYQEVKNIEKSTEITHEMQKLGYNPKFETQWSIISDLCINGDNSERGSTPILPRVFSSMKRLKG